MGVNKMKMFRKISLVLVAALPAAIYAGAGTSSADFLNFTPDARSSAMGGASTGILDSYSQVSGNPGVLGNVYNREAQINYNYLGQDINFFNVNGMWARRKWGNIGGGVTHINYGSINETGADSPDTIGTFTPTATVATASYGTRLSGNKYLADAPMGASVKFIHQSYQSATGTGLALDLGAGYIVRQVDGLTVGVSLLNIGFVNGLGENNDGLPFTFRMGGAYKFEFDKYVFKPILGKNLLRSGERDFLFTLDLAKPGNDDFQINTGIEFRFLSQYAVRMGYEVLHDARFVTFGLGAELNKPYNLRFDLSFVPNSYIDDQYKFTLVYVFDAFKNNPDEIRAAKRRERQEALEKALEEDDKKDDVSDEELFKGIDDGDDTGL